MKRYVYVLCLMVSFAGLNSCSKSSDPAPDPVVVGKWASDYLLTSGFVAPYTTSNAKQLNPLVYGINDNFEIKSDKTFVLTDRSSTVIQTYPGTWDYSGTELSLKYNDGTSEKLTYDGTGAKPHLAYPVVAVSDTLVNPTTNKKELVKFNLQLVYTKQ